jgi:hypothetical protein
MPHRRMARIHYSLAKVALGTGDTDGARTQSARALDQAERGFDPGSRKANQMYTSLTHLFIQLGDGPRIFRAANARSPGRESMVSIEV